MNSIFLKKKVDSTSVQGLPSYMTDGDLISGKVQSSCSLHTGIAGVPIMVNPVSPDFLQSVNDIMEGNAAYGANASNFMAEDTVNGVEYAVAFSSGKIYAMADGNIVDKAKLPKRLVFLLSMPYFMGNNEFASAFDGFKNASDDADKKSYLAMMYDNAYYRDGTNEVAKAFDEKPLTKLTAAKANDPKFAASEVEGTFKTFKMPMAGTVSATITTAKAVMDGSAFNGKFAVVDPSELTEEEREHIFRIDDRFIVTEQHVDICQTIKNSLGGPHPFSNFLLRGAPGGGKSTFVQIVAAGTALPYYSDVLRDDITADFFSGYYAPDCDHIGHHVGLDEYIDSLPKSDDIAFDPVDAYQRITGTENLNATGDDCMKEIYKRVAEMANESKGESKNALTFVEGLVPKLTRPCLIFYDEVTVPKNPGVIAALNTLMDNQRKFTLTSGRVIERHPLSVMMFAGNFGDVEGCREPNRAWQDRNNEILDVAPPTPEQMKAMLIASTGYDSTKNANIPIDMFVGIWPELQKISADYYGVCGPRALCDWLAKSMLIGSPIRAAETTIVAKSSSDVACQAEMMTKIRNRFKN